MSFMPCSGRSGRRSIISRSFTNPGRSISAVARVERKARVGHVTLTNLNFLNAEGDRTAADLETATDLTLLDDRIEACLCAAVPSIIQSITIAVFLIPESI